MTSFSFWFQFRMPWNDIFLILKSYHSSFFYFFYYVTLIVCSSFTPLYSTSNVINVLIWLPYSSHWFYFYLRPTLSLIHDDFLLILLLLLLLLLATSDTVPSCSSTVDQIKAIKHLFVKSSMCAHIFLSTWIACWECFIIVYLAHSSIWYIFVRRQIVL